MSRRVAIVYANASVLENLVKPSYPGVWTRTDRGVPEDAKCIGKGYDFQCDRFYFVYEHPLFPESAQGEYAPEFRGVELSAFHFTDPMTPAAVAEIEKLVRAQIHRATDGKAEAEAMAVSSIFPNGSLALKSYFDIPEKPCDGDEPTAVVGG